MGAIVISTTRNPGKVAALKAVGADFTIIDTGSIHSEVRDLFPDGVSKVLELVGTVSLKDSLKCIGFKGMVCMTGILGNAWALKDFLPMEDIPSCGRLTAYSGGACDLNKAALQSFIQNIETGAIKLSIDRVFSLEDIAAAHQYMEDDKATGKIVVEL